MIKRQGQLIRVARCIYRRLDAKIFFHSLRLPGKSFPTKRKLAATTLRAAIKEVETLNTRRREATLGVGIDPYVQSITVGDLAKTWLATKCQDRAGRPRAGQSLLTESDRLRRLLPFWKSKSPSEITAFEDCPDYHKWRTKTRLKTAASGLRTLFRLGRSVDAELTTLSNLFAWAVMNPRKTGLRYNPLASRPRFDNPKLVRHCTAAMPATDEDFHRLAGYLLASDKSRPLGWQLLLEGMTGCRTAEILTCRLDAQLPEQPGYINHTALHIHRCKDGIEPWALLESAPGHSPLRDCLQAFLNWHEKEHPNNQWFIPGQKSDQSAQRNSLTHALHRACRALKLPLVISHGLRAYFVAALRSMGISDEDIADRLGHRSTDQVEHTYGTVKPGWRGSWTMDFLPEDCAPCWAAWQPRTPYQKLIVPAAKESKTSKQSPTGNIKIGQ